MQQCIQAGLPFPDAIENAPQLADGLSYYLGIWEELSYDRSYGMGAGPIPSSSIRQYLLDHKIELDGEEADDVMYLVRELDLTWLKWAAREHEKKKIQQKNQSSAIGSK